MNPRLPLLALVASLILPNIARAQMLSGGEFNLVGGLHSAPTRLQAEAFTLDGRPASVSAGPLSGGPFSLTADLAVGHPVTPVDPPQLQLTRLPDGRLEISWPEEALRYRLESTTDPAGTTRAWQAIDPAPSGTRHVITPDDATRFFRLTARTPGSTGWRGRRSPDR